MITKLQVKALSVWWLPWTYQCRQKQQEPLRSQEPQKSLSRPCLGLRVQISPCMCPALLTEHLPQIFAKYSKLVTGNRVFGSCPLKIIILSWNKEDISVVARTCLPDYSILSFSQEYIQPFVTRSSPPIPKKECCKTAPTAKEGKFKKGAKKKNWFKNIQCGAWWWQHIPLIPILMR